LVQESLKKPPSDRDFAFSSYQAQARAQISAEKVRTVEGYVTEMRKVRTVEGYVTEMRKVRTVEGYVTEMRKVRAELDPDVSVQCTK
jgi:hypothetical protein